MLQTDTEFSQPEDTKVVIKCQQQKLESYGWIEVNQTTTSLVSIRVVELFLKEALAVII